MLALSLGERIMIFRKRVGLSKKALADRTHLAVSTITKYENDMVANPDHEVLLAISIVLNVSMNMLMFGFDDSAKGTTIEPLIKS